MKLKKQRKSDLMWIEFSKEMRETFADYDENFGIRFLDSEKQSIVYSLITAEDGAGLNEFRLF